MASGNYKVRVTNKGCASFSDSIVVSIIQRSGSVITNSVLRCGAGPVTLQAAGADSIRWFDDQQNLIAVGNELTTPSLSEETIFYVQAGSVCTGPMTSDTVFIRGIPSDPVSGNVKSMRSWSSCADSTGYIRYHVV
jgi:hypothetical protein